jgi:hypothetical protein
MTRARMYWAQAPCVSVDSDCHPLALRVTTTDVQDPDGGTPLVSAPCYPVSLGRRIVVDRGKKSVCRCRSGGNFAQRRSHETTKFTKSPALYRKYRTGIKFLTRDHGIKPQDRLRNVHPCCRMTRALCTNNHPMALSKRTLISMMYQRRRHRDG